MKTIALCSVLYSALFLPAAVGEEVILDETMTVRPGETLVLDLAAGGSVSLIGKQTNKLHVVCYRGDPGNCNSTAKVERAGATVRVTSDCPKRYLNMRSSKLRFEVTLPQSFEIEVDSAGGGLVVESISGSIRGKTGGGTLRLNDVRGELALRTGGGGIFISKSEVSGWLRTGGGKIKIKDVNGEFRARTGGGDVRVEGGELKGSVTTGGGEIHIEDVSGELHAETGAGDIQVEGADLKGSVATGAGNVHLLGVRRDFKARTGRGKVKRVRQKESDRNGGNADGATTIRKSGGSITLDEAPYGADLHTKGGEITVRSVSRFLKATTMGGDISIGTVDGSAKTYTYGGDIEIRAAKGPVVATTRAGDIEIRAAKGSVVAKTYSGDVDVTVVDAGQIGNEGINLRSLQGDIVLRVPREISAAFDIELAYTKNSSRRFAIRSDFPVEQSETKEWDASNGTPRRYIRGKGVANGGDHSIRIRTINGNVRIERVEE